jgi:Fe-Mn family superoxide dismutase
MAVTRREFCLSGVGAAALALTQTTAFAKTKNSPLRRDKMSFTLPPLPFAKDALEPHISATTFEFHHGKHHNAYVVNLNKEIEGTDLAGKSLEEIIKASEGKLPKVFNNSAQVWNHAFFWHSLSPNGGGKPTGALLAQIEKDFGSYDKFVEEFKNAAATQFGSGWAWLVDDAGTLKVVKTGNAELPLTKGQKAILTLDVWEHAYYLDYQNRRPDFISTFIEKLANWEFAAANFASKEGFIFANDAEKKAA